MMLEVGQEAPDFTLRNRDNEDVTLSSFRGEKNVVLLFYPLAFSGTCMKQFIDLGTSVGRYGDAEILAISVDSRYVQGVFQDQVGANNATFLADFEPKGAVARAYDVWMDVGWSTRAAFVIDKSGVVRHADVMAVPTDRPSEDAYLAALAACPA